MHDHSVVFYPWAPEKPLVRMFQGFLTRRVFTPQIYAFEFFFSLFSRLRHLVYVNYTDVSYNVLGKMICQKKIPFFECVHPKSYKNSILCCLKNLLFHHVCILTFLFQRVAVSSPPPSAVIC